MQCITCHLRVVHACSTSRMACTMYPVSCTMRAIHCVLCAMWYYACYTLCAVCYVVLWRRLIIVMMTLLRSCRSHGNHAHHDTCHGAGTSCRDLHGWLVYWCCDDDHALLLPSSHRSSFDHRADDLVAFMLTKR